ncbi:Long-chain-fatty-acid--CoA ligase [Sphingobium indicum BiD32]|uniref:3-methylmercaptopropionyl-CoA ligase n=1 Tax=Sphingobium indicum BiD32 TaxID=1301087 RepID=N1MWQ9_9SPHN|nr:fatty acyl-CoA synthetase [Sphingobium indicum]CCW20007.1 Long-chain-fatty-acid--CoA ligase [Sphingobium indicum BiD32]
MSQESSAIFGGVVRSARRTPDAVAIRFAGRIWTYRQLVAAAIAFAKDLAREGVHEGDRVAFLGRNSDAYAIGFLATQYLGAIHVPVNFMLGSHEVAYILDHAAPTVLLADAEFMETARDAADAISVQVNCRLLESPIETDVGIPAGETSRAVMTRPAQLAYTSGTESSPKGALLSDQGLIHQYMSCIAVGEYRSTDVVLHALPLYHCAQLHCFLIPFLFLGAENIILDRVDIGEVIEAIEANGVTSFFAPPTVWIGILGHKMFAPERMSMLTKGYYGASIMPTEVIHRMRGQMPWLRLWNYYGQTEIGPLATALTPEEHDERPSSAGRPVLFVETRIVDNDMRDVATGEVGEIVHRSPQLLLRYYRAPEITAAAFEGGWFHSGDLATCDAEGYITIVDRKKDMINSGGENVSSREVEEALYRHPAISEVSVIGLPDTKWIERVCAAVVLKDGFSATNEDLLSMCSDLAPFKRPKQIEFVTALPKNPSGKILKRELRLQLS